MEHKIFSKMGIQDIAPPRHDALSKETKKPSKIDLPESIKEKNKRDFDDGYRKYSKSFKTSGMPITFDMNAWSNNNRASVGSILPSFTRQADGILIGLLIIYTVKSSFGGVPIGDTGRTRNIFQWIDIAIGIFLATKIVSSARLSI